MKLKIIMPDVVTPSLNQLNRLMITGNYFSIMRMKKTYWQTLLLCEADDPKWKAKNKEFRKVEFTSFRPRRLDYDNLVGGFKYLLDILTKMQLIYDDSPRYCKVIYNQEVVKGNFKTEIVISNE